MADESSIHPPSPKSISAIDAAVGPQHADRTDVETSTRSKDRKKRKFPSAPPVPSAPLGSFNATAPSSNIQRADGAAATVTGAPNDTASDEQLVDRTKQQIRTLVNEITQLAKSDCSVEDFYQGFLTRTTGALASEGGAIWIRPSVEEPLQLIYHINLKNTVLATDPTAQRQHAALLKKTANAGEPEIIAPLSQGLQPDQAGNPTENLLIMGPLIVNNQTIGLVEILQRPGAGPTTQRGYLRFLMQMCDIASDFLTNEKIRSFSSQQTMWSKFEQFIKSVHNGLDTRETAYVIANEGRRVIDCDRVSVVLKKGGRCNVASVSGLDSIERRADQIKRLGSLAKTTIKGSSPVWYDGDDSRLAPQIEAKLQKYVDQSHSKMVAIVPLYRQQRDAEESSDKRPARKGKPVGALIVEQLKDARITPDFRKRVDVVTEHAQTAITNSLEHNAIFLLPLWKAIGKISSAMRGGRLVKTIATVAVLCAVAAFLYLLPYPFSVGASGKLIPQQQHQVYAQVDGVVEELFVSDLGDTIVQQGQVLATLSSNDLAVVIENLNNSIEEVRARLKTSEALRTQDSLDSYQQTTLQIDIGQARQEIIGLENELRLRESEAENLKIIAPVSGVVTNWQARQNLIRRPVERGQNLMTIVENDAQWMLELELPERRIGHMIKAANAAFEDGEAARVTFSLVSHPGAEFEGRMMMVDHQVDAHSDEGNTCLIRVSFDNEAIDRDLLRKGTRVNAKIHCGQRSVGYVMFHEAIEAVHSTYLLWF